MISRDLTFYKQEDSVARIVETLDPNQNPTNDRNFTASLQPDVSRIPISFGHTLLEPVPIFSIDGPTTQYNVPEETRTKIIFYAISANRTPINLSDFVGNVYVNGTLVTGLVPISPTTNKRIATGDWRTGATSTTSSAFVGGALNAGVSGNFGGNQFQFGSNLYVGYVRASSDFTQHAFYKMFSGQIPGILQGFNIIKDFPNNQNYDMLAVFYKFNKLYFNNENPRLQLTYRRHPKVPTEAGATRREPNVGNCLLELFGNSEYGMGLTRDVDYVDSDFRDIGSPMAGVFDLTNQPLFEIAKSITEERTNYRLHELAGQLRFSQTLSTGIAITDDNIIGDIEIQYPDNAVAPTKIIATYNSYSGGSTEIEIGSDETNVISIDLKTANNLADAKTLLESIWTNLNDTITINFTADRSFNQFSILDQLTLSTEVFSGLITVVAISQNFDYTFSVTAHASAGTVAPNANLREATPVIQIGENFYRPPEQEPTPDPTEPPVDEIILPPQPIPPAPSLLTIDGLNHPYNHITGGDNTNWYLGGTEDGITADANYDANGCRTRFIGAGGGAVLSTDFSLIQRDQNSQKPTAIECTIDIAIGTEQNNNLVGFNKGDYRFDYPKFFNNQTESVRYNNGSGWNVWNNKPWPNVYNQRPVYQGGGDPFYDQANTFDYQYQTETFGFADRQRKPHMILSNNIYRPSNLDFFWATPNMQRSGVYRLHFTAIYGPVASPTQVEYIGSTTTYGDFRSIQAQDVGEARTTAQTFAQDFNPVTATPPSRGIG